jgi:hypothetical protein
MDNLDALADGQEIVAEDDIFYGIEDFMEQWGVWRSKGQSPVSQLEVFQSRQSGGGVHYSVGLRGYADWEQCFFVSMASWATEALAHAEVTKAINKATKCPATRSGAPL